MSRLSRLSRPFRSHRVSCPRRLLLLVAASSLLVTVAAWPLRAAGEEAEDESKPATHKVAKGLFQIELTLEGAFESRSMHEVLIGTDQWTDLTVREVAAHGAKVKKGDVLLACDLSKIQESIKDLETTIKIAELSLEQARAEIQALEQSVPEDLAEAERAKKAADVNLKYFLDTEREWNHRSNEFTVKVGNQMLENAQEELKQLEKMYKADDLTEGTEEIILKQQRFQVEYGKFVLEQAKILREKARDIDLPREEEALREAATQRTLALHKAERDLPLQLNMKRLELGKLKLEHTKDRERLARLKRDAEAMTLRSPADGMVFYGACEHGQWSHASDMAAKLRRGGSLTAHEVLMTVAQPDSFIRVTIPEKELHDVTVGLAGRFTPTAFPEAQFKASVESVPGFADTSGKYTAVVAFDSKSLAGAQPTVLNQGMTGSFKALVYKQAAALTVPAKSVFSDENDGSQHYVYVREKDESVRRDVKIGRRTEARVEILSGLNEGDEVLLKKPEEE